MRIDFLEVIALFLHTAAYILEKLRVSAKLISYTVFFRNLLYKNSRLLLTPLYRLSTILYIPFSTFQCTRQYIIIC